MSTGHPFSRDESPAIDNRESSALQRPPGDCYFNRELSWLSFNDRVLSAADNADNPLLERLRFLSISGSNLDEFMMIRVAGLAGQVNRGIERLSIDGQTPSQQLGAIRERIDALEQRQQASLSEIGRLLEGEGVRIAAIASLDADRRRELRQYFVHHILPALTPQAIDPAHPFPFVPNLGMGLLFDLERKDGGGSLTSMVLIPSGLNRFVRLAGDDATYVAIEDLIRTHANSLFPGFEVHRDGVFRILRDSDIEIEEEAEDLVRYFRSAIQRRRRGSVIRLELEEAFDNDAEALLREQLTVPQTMVARTRGLLGIADLAAIVDEDRAELKFAPYTPRYPERVTEYDGDCFAAIRAKDFIVHHPYESFEVVVDFVRQAARDPAVIAIKQTLYRAGDQSPIINALIEAAENGKSVTAVVELKARFDEERNLQWASELERAGVQVIYGFVDWKTHAKVAMVVRREDGVNRTYCHFGTGNYHPLTSRIYTDLSFFTADPRYGRDAGKLFNFITGYVEPKAELLAISPLNLRATLYELIDREIENSRKGRPAAIWAKLNSLTEKGVIDRLYDASAAGVDIRLVVRGNCCLRPGVPGLSENIRVKSIIGRFLEHGRIWAFANGYALPSARAKVYISSADAMSRNLNRRIEVLVPIRNATVHDQVLEQVLMANLLDDVLSWNLQSDGSYERAPLGETPFNCHDYFMTNPSLSGRGEALGSKSVPKLSLGRRAR